VKELQTETEITGGVIFLVCLMFVLKTLFDGVR